MSKFLKDWRQGFMYAPDDPPGGGGDDDPVDDDPEADDPPADDPPAPDPEIDALKAQIAELKAQRPAPPVQAQGAPELIPETNIPKPDGYDLWGIDRQIAHIAGVTAHGTIQMNMAASRNARNIEAKADDWYRPYVQKVIDGTDPRYLAQDLNDEMVESMLELAMGKALKDGKTPASASKPVPGASPVGTRPVVKTAQASEVDEVLSGLRNAGYDKVADSPAVRKILERAS